MKNVKNRINAILSKTPNEVTMVEFAYLKNNVTYEILNELIDKSGIGIDIEGVTTDEDEAILQLLKMI